MSFIEVRYQALFPWLLYRFLWGSLCFCLFVSHALAQETVRTRTWQHSDFARIVFDWPEKVGYRAAINGQVLTLEFDRPMQTDFNSVTERLGNYITSSRISDNGLTLSFQLTGPMVLGQYTYENSIVIDLQNAPRIDSGQARVNLQSTADGPLIPLGVRIGAHPEYTRIVFDWEATPSYRVTKTGPEVLIEFDAAAIIDPTHLSDALPPGVRFEGIKTADGKTRIRFAVPEVATVSDFVLGTKVVMDVRASVAIRNKPIPPLEPDAGAEPVETVASADSATSPGTENPDEQSSPEDVAQAKEDDPARDSRGTPPEPGREEAPGSTGQQDEQTEPDPAPPSPPPSPTASPSSPVTETPGKVPEQSADYGLPLFTYTFPFPEEVGAAVFRRGGNIWLIFDYAAPIEGLENLRREGASVVERLDQIPVRNATVLRAFIPDTRINAQARREGFEWVVEFRMAVQKPLFQVGIEADITSDIGPYLSILSRTPGTVLNIPDSDVGDTMRVATLHESGVGVDGIRRYSEFELLSTSQGVALISLSDQVLLDRGFDGFQISGPDGLAISGIAPEAPLSSGKTLSSRRLFDIAGMMRGPMEEYTELEIALFRSMAEVPDEKIDTARLAYAGFLTAHDRGHEALGIMRVIARNNAQLMKRPENQALQAAASVLANRSEEALSLLNDPRLEGFAEAAIWRGAALVQSGQAKAAHDAFNAGDALLSRYPFPLRAKLGLLRIETAFQNRDIAAAASWIEALQKDRASLLPAEHIALDYHRGRLAVTSQGFDDAEELFLDVMDSGNRKYAYLAERAYLTVGRKQGLVSNEEAIERYERLRYAWRSGSEELSLLRALGALYLEEPDYFEGLETYRTAVKLFPEEIETEQLVDEMTDVFVDLFLDGQADSLPPLKAIAIYEEFRELTPSGRDGDSLIEDIADRLISIDLLPEAAGKLEELLANKDRVPPGEERIRLSSKLALVYLMNGQPEKAETTLNENRLDFDLFEIDRDLEDDRNRLLARAEFQQSEYEKAIKELAGDVSLEADLIRSDLYRTTQDWRETAKVMQRLAGNPPNDPTEVLDPRISRYVINWAVALFLNDDQAGLQDIIDLWEPVMGNSSLAGVFDYVTDLTQPPDVDDILVTVDRLIGSDQFDVFLETYKERLFTRPEPEAVEANAESF